MKKLKVALATAGLSAAFGFAGSVGAQSGAGAWYIGGTLGQAEFKDACQGLGGCDEKDTAWRILGGYQINRNFSAEIGLRQGRLLPGRARGAGRKRDQ